MANKKKLQRAAIKFRKQSPDLYSVCAFLLSRAAAFIVKSGASEVTVGIKNGGYYESTNS